MTKYAIGGAVITTGLGAIALFSTGSQTWAGNYGFFFGLLGILAVFGAIFGALIGFAVKLFSRNDDERAREDQEYRKGFGDAARGRGTITMGALACGAAVFWFIAGLAANRIYFYPPILLVFGLISIGRGLTIGSKGDDSPDTRNGDFG